MDSLLHQLSDSPARLAWAEAHLSEPEVLHAFLDAVDDSPYSLRQWVDAFLVLGQWLDAHGWRASFQDQLGYLSCACESVGSGANLTPLASVVSEMLDRYGFESAQRKREDPLAE